MPARHGYSTPDEIPESAVCRTLAIPDDPLIRAAVFGALHELTFERNWEQVGEVTVEEMALAMVLMLDDYLSQECEVATFVERYLFAHIEAVNVNGGGIAIGNNTVPYNTVNYAESSPKVTLASNVFTVDPGRWRIEAWHLIIGGSNCRLDSVWAGTNAPANNYGMTQRNVGLRTPFQMSIDADVTDQNTLYFNLNAQAASALLGFGERINQGGNSEAYGQVSFLRLGDLP